MTQLYDGREIKDTTEAPFQQYVAITPADATVLSGLRAIRAACTVAGNVTLVGQDGSTFVWPLVVGLNQIADSPKNVKATGLTATAVFTGLK